MIEKVAFTPATSVAQTPENEMNFQSLPKQETKQDNSALLYGSLAALGAFGLGLVIRKPKVVEKEVVKTVEKAAETAKSATESIPKKVKIKSKTRTGNELNIAGRENTNRMNKTDAKWQRKREKQLLNKQMQREAEESFTEQELQTYINENGYQAPTSQQKIDIDNLHRQNAQQRAQTNTIGNLAQRPEAKPVKAPVENPELKGIEGSITALERRIAGARKFGKDTSKLEMQLKTLIEKRNSVLNNAAQTA